MKYILPLREGGSLPAIVEGDDGEQYVMKFTGAGQGSKALIAELIAGEIGRHLGFRIPDLVLLDFDPVIGRTEADPEIQDLLKASGGINLGMKFLPQASAFSLLLEKPRPTAEFASRLVWFDAFVTNVDRTPKNANMLVHKGEIWLIDHGAALNFHHNWQDHIKQSETPFQFIKQHILLPLADTIGAADEQLRAVLSRELFEETVAAIPDQWLDSARPFDHSEQYRQGYVEYLTHRLANSSLFVEEAENARAQLV
jgi:hypothetical protein